MRLLNENYQEIREQDIDLTKGFIYGATIIRPDAQSQGKIVWTDDDYERVRIYHEYTPEELELAKPVPTIWDELDEAYREGVDSV